MLFNSIEFLVFFPLVTFLYFALPQYLRVYLLLAASCAFYMAFIPAYILILFVVILIDYLAGFLIAGTQGANRRMWLGMSLVANIGLLAAFKYFNFINQNLAALAEFVRWNYPIENLALILPLGLSFHTFQAMSYTIEVYRGRQRPERSLPYYALYVLFYPQLVAGPIERPQNLLHQFREPHTFDYARVTAGLKLMGWGMFKKVAAVYAAPERYDGFGLTVATVFFAFQIYCDFSGYSDIALGAAHVMGFKLMNNFKQPYLAQSIGEFWKRWHISLSSWFKDYMYFPMGGNRLGFGRMCFNIFAVFLVSGLWHGANWTFLIWGAMHGTYRLTEVFLENRRISVTHLVGLDRSPRCCRVLNSLWVFVLVSIGWVFFRAANVQEAWYILTHFHTGWSVLADGHLLRTQLDMLGLPLSKLAPALLVLAVLWAVDVLRDRGPLRPRIESQPLYVRWGLYYALLIGILAFGVFGKNQFIYFQF
jgi:alginate O-acetyltransferase complex protein AlgI